MKTVFRLAGNSPRRQSRGSPRKPGGGRRAFNQRCAVRVMFSPNRITGQWRAHGRYITRETATQGRLGRAFGDQGETVAPVAEVLDRWQKDGDPRVWKLIISPEFGERIDLNQLTCDLVSRMENDLGTRLEWVAVPHFQY
jgi:type IV secretory pathway VirD2 relaxase